MKIELQAQKVKAASIEFANTSVVLRNSVLAKISDELIKNTDSIIKANNIDIAKAKQKGLNDSMIDRLLLNKQRITDIAFSVKEIINLADVLGEVESWERPNGLLISKKRVSIGVIGIIYEARPNVTVDVAALCIKSGNSVLLRGSEEAINSNLELVRIIKNAIKSVGLNENIVEIVEDTSRETATQLMKLNKYIDVLIPRGGKGLIKAVADNATIPVLFADAGNCHTYIDDCADLKMGVDILVNAKCSRPSVCNACETLLVHEKIADSFLPAVFTELEKRKVDIRFPATEQDFQTEFNDLILAVRVVKDIDEAISHIGTYGTKHSECIVTNSLENAQKFSKLVDAAAVYVNASTRFTDGFEFGFGAEMGVSTQKLHARGPIGLRELTTYKYIVHGFGQVRC